MKFKSKITFNCKGNPSIVVGLTLQTVDDDDKCTD